jgi:lysozyme
MTPIRKVIDISHHNDVADWDAVKGAGIVGIIHKATEGTSFLDEDYLSRAREALDRGFMWGAYHIATGASVPAQVDHFLRVAGVDDETLYALHWEDDPGGNAMSLNGAVEFMQRIGQRIGMHRCVMYSGNTAKEKIGSRDVDFLGKHRLWLAQYGQSPVAQRSWDSIWLWQYSDGNVGPQPHGCPGITGECDTNSFDGLDAQLRLQWSGAAAVAPTDQARVDIRTSGRVTVTVNGRPVVTS